MSRSRAMEIIVERGRSIIADEAIVANSPLACHYEQGIAETAKRRTEDITVEWYRLNAIRPGAIPLSVLIRSAYLQGVNDCAEVAARSEPKGGTP